MMHHPASSSVWCGVSHVLLGSESDQGGICVQSRTLLASLSVTINDKQRRKSSLSLKNLQTHESRRGQPEEIIGNCILNKVLGVDSLLKTKSIVLCSRTPHTLEPGSVAFHVILEVYDLSVLEQWTDLLTKSML